MTPDEIERRLNVSRQTLWGWRNTSGLPSGPVADTLAMITAEIDILESIAADHPDQAGTIGTLASEWRALADHIRSKSN